MITSEQARQYFRYEKETGLIRWNISRGTAKQGDIAGKLGNRGYVQIKVLGKIYQAHRLAWLIVEGEWPDTIDHINKVKNDNRWDNLRNSSQQENMCNVPLRKNNTSGVRGVSWNSRRGLWQVEVKSKKIRYFLGCYEDIELAELVASEARVKFHKEYASCVI